MDAGAIAARVAAFPFWYHRIELPCGVVTPGWAPIDKNAYRVPADLTGRRVLDVGAWDGFWSFEALRRGAREVVAIDDFSDLLGRLQPSERAGWGTFDLCRELLGYNEEQCRRLEMSVYDVSEAMLGRFDVVFAFGVVYHLRHPLLALDRLSAICDGEIYLESAICDDYSPYRGGLGHGYPGGQMVAEFYPDAQYAANPTNWWIPTLHCLTHMVRSAGFPTVEAWRASDESPDRLAPYRGYVRGRKH
jgi:tRNA (mo5U34)-methyltransferase